MIYLKNICNNVSPFYILPLSFEQYMYVPYLINHLLWIRVQKYLIS